MAFRPIRFSCLFIRRDDVSCKKCSIPYPFIIVNNWISFWLAPFMRDTGQGLMSRTLFESVSESDSRCMFLTKGNETKQAYLIPPLLLINWEFKGCKACCGQNNLFLLLICS